MRDIIFQELRESNRAIRQNNNILEHENGEKILVEIVNKICELSVVVRNYGLLALEDGISDIDNIYNGKYLKAMIELVIDGTDPVIIEEISTAKYFSADLSGYEALHYLTMMFGTISLQEGENPNIIEEKLLSMLPEGTVNLYRTLKQEKQSEDAEEDLFKELYNGEIAVDPGDENYFQIKVTDCAIKSLGDNSIQRLLLDIENNDLALAMKGLSGEARHRLLDNISRRLGMMIVQDMKLMGPVRIKVVADSIIKILNVIIKLISRGEIVSTDEDILRLFGKIFEATGTEAVNNKIEEAESDLYKIMREYKSSSHKVIDAPWGKCSV